MRGRRNMSPQRFQREYIVSTTVFLGVCNGYALNDHCIHLFHSTPRLQLGNMPNEFEGIILFCGTDIAHETRLF